MNLPVKETKKTVSEYRALECISYSGLKLFITDRKKFHKKFVLCEPVDDETSFAMVMGNLTDCLKFTPDDFDKNFAVSSAIEPKGQMLDFVNELYRITLKYTVDGKVSRDIADILMDTYLSVAFDAAGKPVKFKGKSFEKVVELFRDGEGELYYEELRRNTGKQVISLETLKRAEATVDLLNNNFVTYELFSEREGVDIYQQEPIEFQYMDMEVKCLPDHFEVHHKIKEIHPYDLKCTWQVEDFAYNYIKNRYDIQATVYYEGLESWKKKHNLQDYIVKPMSFIACDTTGLTNPLIHRTSYKDLNASKKGFSVNGRNYIGVEEAMIELKWATETGNWNISKKAYEQKGIMNLDIMYGY